MKDKENLMDCSSLKDTKETLIASCTGEDHYTKYIIGTIEEIEISAVY